MCIRMKRGATRTPRRRLWTRRLPPRRKLWDSRGPTFAGGGNAGDAAAGGRFRTFEGGGSPVVVLDAADGHAGFGAGGGGDGAVVLRGSLVASWGYVGCVEGDGDVSFLF